MIQSFETGKAGGKSVNKTLRANTPMAGQAHADCFDHHRLAELGAGPVVLELG